MWPATRSTSAPRGATAACTGGSPRAGGAAPPPPAAARGGAGARRGGGRITSRAPPPPHGRSVPRRNGRAIRIEAILFNDRRQQEILIATQAPARDYDG